MTPEESLDYEFLKYIGVVPETQKRIQGYYLPFFEGCETVVDLGCGQGDFLELLKENGIKGLGVDYDPKCCAIARERGLDVACQDVFVYLGEANEESVDGVFSAHLVEHLPYEKVIEFFRLSHRALRKGGKIVITTPNVRGLFAHLEMFYMHFGHVSFYHPNLLSFFLEYVGFSDVQMGENPRTASPLLSGIPRTLNDGGSEEVRVPGESASPLPPGMEAAPNHGENDETGTPRPPAPQEQGAGQSPPSKEMRGDPVALVSYDLHLPLARDTIFHRLFRVVKMFAVRLIVQPYLDRITVAINTSLAQVNSTFAQVESRLAEVDGRLAQVESRVTELDSRLVQLESRLAEVDDRFAQVENRLVEVDNKFEDVHYILRRIKELDRPFECYVTAIKG